MKIIKFIGLNIFLPLAVVACIYLGFWGLAYYQASTYPDKAVEDLKEQGYTLTHNPLSISGFPQKVEATTSNIQITDFNALYSLFIDEADVKFWPLPGRPARLVIPNLEIGQALEPLPLLKVTDIEAQTTLPALFYTLSDDIKFQAKAQQLTLDNAFHVPVSRNIEKIWLSMEIEDDSQKIHINEARFVWEGMTTKISGMAYVDDQGHKQGNMKITFTNFTDALNLILTEMELNPQVKMGLSALTLISRNNNGQQEISMPLVIIDNEVKLGAFTIGYLH